jgi:anti-anti-sigma factor
MEMIVEDAGDGVTVAVLKGRLDIAGAAAIDLKFNALAGGRRLLVIDLSEVGFIASMGIRLLLMAARTVAAKGGKMALAAPNADVASVLATARIDGVVPVCDSRAAAIAATR